MERRGTSGAPPFPKGVERREGGREGGRERGSIEFTSNSVTFL